MPKIVLIGAGSVKFTCNLINDILLTPALSDTHIALVDIDTERLELAGTLVRALMERHGSAVRLDLTTDRREVLTGADYVIVTILVGGIQAYTSDINIPLMYGVGQNVGDTLGPGGIFRGLRHIPVLMGICQDMAEFCPDALLMNYSNPMAILCNAIAWGSGIRHVGLCHSVQGTSKMLTSWIGAADADVSYWVAGINHQAWFLKFLWRGEDAYPLLRECIQKPEIVGDEPVRTDLMKHFGYFVTESSGHASEYSPYFRKNEDQIAALVHRFTSPRSNWFDSGRTGGCLRHDQQRTEEFTATVRDRSALDAFLPKNRSHEYGSYIIEAIQTNRPVRINGNVPNEGLITNLPHGCCVEVPCIVDGTGLHPCVVGELPEQLAALNRTNVNVQVLAAKGSLAGDREAIYHAAMLDPLTGAVCSLPNIQAMVDELFEAETVWLPQFE